MLLTNLTDALLTLVTKFVATEDEWSQWYNMPVKVDLDTEKITLNVDSIYYDELLQTLFIKVDWKGQSFQRIQK